MAQKMPSSQLHVHAQCCKCNLFTHEAPKCSRNSFKGVWCACQVELELILEMLIFVEGGKPENPKKNPRGKDENQQQTQSTYDAKSGNQTQVTLVGSKCLTSAPSLLPCAVYSVILLHVLLQCSMPTSFDQHCSCYLGFLK